MGKADLSAAFKRDAVAQITVRGYPLAEVSQRLGVSQHSLDAWKRQLGRTSGSPARLPSSATSTGAASCPISMPDRLARYHHPV
jgi:transposase-like protein